MSLHVVLTGGGTAGHVNPNLALIEALRAQQCDVAYIGCAEGVERSMVQAMSVPFYAVRSGKLRRYFSWQNFIDPFNLIIGIAQSWWLLRRLKPQIVFSKGGFVALPVVIGAWLNHIPVIAHESDLTPGLANRLSFPFVDTLCVTFESSKQKFKHQDKIQITGTPIRQGLLDGSREKGLSRCGFDTTKPCLLIMGGSQGARALNACVRELLPRILSRFHVIHLCGKGNVDPAYAHENGYCQLEYAHEELADFLAASDVIISRAGANALYEILACGKPHVLVPLSRRSSRGDQIHNAQYFKDKGVSVVVEEEALTPVSLLAAVDDVQASRDVLAKRIAALHVESATSTIMNLIVQKAQCV